MPNPYGGNYGPPYNEAFDGGVGPGTFDPNVLAQLMGQQYNPYQGYPLKQVSDQLWDVYGPTPDYLIAQQVGRMTPNPDEFNRDTFYAADPLLRGPLAEALSHGKGNDIDAYAYLQDPDVRKHMLNQIGRTEWDQIANTGDLRMLGATTGAEKDQAALDYYQRGIEDLLAQGAPTQQRAMQNYDYIAQRMGGRPYPGAGDYSSNGAAMGGGGAGGSDPLAQLASSPAYSGGSSHPHVNLDATPEGTPFGEGVQEIGRASGPDRLLNEAGHRQAVIGGRLYDIPDTMERPGGRLNPEYQRALQYVVSNRRHQQDGSGGGQRAASYGSSDEAKRGLAAEVWHRVFGMGSLIH